MNTKKNKKKFLNLNIILAASKGDIEAMGIVLKHYEGYIRRLSIRRLYDEDGYIHYCVDETLKERLEAKLIDKILSFKIA